MKKMVLAWLLVMCLPVYAAVSVRAAPSVVRHAVIVQKSVARIPIKQVKKREIPMVMPPPVVLHHATGCYGKKGCKK